MAIDGGSVEIRFEGDVSPLRRSVEEAVDSIESVKAAASEVEESLEQGFGSNWSREARGRFVDFADSACDSIERVVDSSLSAGSALKAIGSSLKEIGQVAVTTSLAAATTGLVKMAKAGINDTSALENVKIQMIGLTDSVEKGNEAMRMAVQYYKNNPFNRFEVTNATKSLVQFGAQLKEVPGLLDKLGKVSLSTGAKIDTLAYYYQRMVSDGRISMMDLQQMQTNNVPIMGKLAERLGTTAGGLRDLAREGKIAVEDFKAAFDDLVSDEAMAQFEKTLSRQIDRISGRMSDLKGALAGYRTSETGDPLMIDEAGLYRSYTKFIKKISDVLTNSGDTANPIGVNVIEGFQKLSRILGGLIDKITAVVEPALNAFGKVLNFVGDNAALLIPIFGGLLMTISNLGSSLPVIGPVLSKLNTSFKGLGNSILGLVKVHPILSTFIAVFGVGFVNAMKNSEEFRNTMRSIGSSLSQIFQNLSEMFRGVIDVLGRVFNVLANSGVVQGILQGIASALAWLAKALASISPETLAGLMSFFVSLKLLKANPIMFVVSAIAMLITYIKELGGIGKFFEDLPQRLKTIGHNLITGLVNGIKEGAKKVIEYTKSLASAITSTFRNMLGIHSPSTVMYDMGKYVVLGLAEGISDNENVVEVAMDNLAKDILKLSEKVIGDKVDFGVLDLKGQYQEWKKVSQMFAVGSEQYNQAVEKMESARKNANLKILDLQKTYNESLDRTISKIASMYNLFDDVKLQAGKNAQQILKGLDQQVAKTQEWAEAQKMIRQSGLDPRLVKELQSMGVDAVGELSAIANMTADELSLLNDMWLQKQEIANAEGVAQMEDLKNDTLAEINDLKNGIDGITVDIADVGGRLVESISEGVYGAMPTLDNAFNKLGDYIKKASKSIGGSGNNVNGGGGLDDNLEVPGTGNMLEELTGNFASLKDMLPKMLLGAAGAVGVVKFGPKIFKAIKNKLFGSKGDVFSDLLSGVFGSMKSGTFNKDTLAGVADVLFQNTKEGPLKDFWATLTGKLGSDEFFEDSSQAVKKTAKTLKQTVNPAREIGQSASEISGSVSNTGKSMSKASGWMDKIKEGAKTIIYIAGAIAAVAAALWVTYNALKDVDFGKLALQLIAMGLAVVEFGALAKIADMLKIGIGGILAIAGIAADIALVAVACRVAYEAMKPVDFGGFQYSLLIMLEALTVFGGFSALLGLFSPIVGPGLLMIAGVAADVVLVALACKHAYDSMKDIDFEKYQYIILEMIEALGVMGGFSAVFGLLAPLVGLGWLSITAICDELCKVSDALYKVYMTVPDDFDNVNAKIDLIKKVLNKIVDTDLGTLIGSIVASWQVGPLTSVMNMYVEIAKQLNKLQDIKLDAERITSNLDKVKNAIDQVKSKTGFISALLQSWADEANANSVQSAGRVITIYGEIIDTLDKLGNVKIKDNVITGVQTMSNFVQKVLDEISKISTGWFVDVGAIEKNVGYAQSILNKFTGIIPTVNEQIVGQSVNESEAIKTIQGVSNIVSAIGKINETGGMENKEKIVGYAQSILNKFTGILPTVKQLVSDGIDATLEANAKECIARVRNLVYEIGQINQAGGIENKEKIVDKTQSILNKFTELVPTIRQLTGMQVDSEAAISAISNVRHLIYEIGQINQSDSGSLSNKEWIVGMASSIAWKMSEFANATRNIGDVNSGAVSNVITAMQNLFTSIESSMTEKMVAFENIGVSIGQSMANGISSQSEAMWNAGNALQSSLWQAIEAKMNDEYQQGVWMATQFSNGLKSVSFENIGAQMQSSLWWGIQNRMQDQYYQGQAMGQKFRQGLYDIDYANAGWWAVQGFINGANNRDPYSAGWQIANRFLQGLRDRGQQGSPWKTTIESGQWAVEGLIEGIKEQETALVGEATSLADQVIDALTMDNLTMSPTLDANVNGHLAPSMAEGEYAIVGGNGQGVVINQTNTNYTEYDVEQVQRDLAWELSKV